MAKVAKRISQTSPSEEETSPSEEGEREHGCWICVLLPFPFLKFLPGLTWQWPTVLMPAEVGIEAENAS